MHSSAASIAAPDPAVTVPPAGPQPTRADTIRSQIMFVLAFLDLLVLAGLIHRAPSAGITRIEQQLLLYTPMALWPVFVLESLWTYFHRDRGKPRWPFLWRVILVWILPPWRMGLVDPRTGLIWLPRAGWCEPGKPLFDRLEVVFSKPMLLFAFLILPVLIIEYVKKEEVENNPILAFALDVGIAVIWVAFATEFVLKASVHPKPFRFAKERWLDVAIVVLPVVEFMLVYSDAAPLARLLRLGRAISPEQLARMQRLYRLQGLLTKAWHALLLIEGVARLLGQTPEKRLAKLELRMAELEEELAGLRRQADQLRDKILQEALRAGTAQNPPEQASGGGGGFPAGDVVTASSRPSAP